MDPMFYLAVVFKFSTDLNCLIGIIDLAIATLQLNVVLWYIMYLYHSIS